MMRTKDPMTPAQRCAALVQLDKVIRERNTWDDLRALSAYEDLWEIAYGQACEAQSINAVADAIEAWLDEDDKNPQERAGADPDR